LYFIVVAVIQDVGEVPAAPLEETRLDTFAL
jgi:hypothetical protein